MKPHLVPDPSLPNGEIRCNPATRFALFKAGLGDLDIVLEPLPVAPVPKST